MRLAEYGSFAVVTSEHGCSNRMRDLMYFMRINVWSWQYHRDTTRVTRLDGVEILPMKI